MKNFKEKEVVDLSSIVGGAQKIELCFRWNPEKKMYEVDVVYSPSPKPLPAPAPSDSTNAVFA